MRILTTYWTTSIDEKEFHFFFLIQQHKFEKNKIKTKRIMSIIIQNFFKIFILCGFLMLTFNGKEKSLLTWDLNGHPY